MNPAECAASPRNRGSEWRLVALKKRDPFCIEVAKRFPDLLFPAPLRFICDSGDEERILRLYRSLVAMDALEAAEVFSPEGLILRHEPALQALAKI